MSVPSTLPPGRMRSSSARGIPFVSRLGLLVAVLAVLGVFAVHGVPSAQAQTLGAPDTYQMQQAHLGFYLWWDESPGATGYDIQISSQSGGTWSQWSDVTHSGTAQPAIVAGLTDGTSYRWRIRATKAGEQSAWTVPIGDSRDTRTARSFNEEKPNPPILRSAVPGPGQVTVTWEAGPERSGVTVTGYLVRYRWENEQGEMTTRSIRVVDARTTTGVVTGLTPGVQYDLWVHPFVGDSRGAGSRVLQAVPQDLPPVVQFETGAYEVVENASSPQISLNISPAPAAAVTVRVSVATDWPVRGSGACQPGWDFTSGPAFDTAVSAGDSQPGVGGSISICDDQVPEEDEIFTLSIEEGTGYVVGDKSTATLTIKDDDTAHGVSPGLPSLELVTASPNQPTATTLTFEIGCVWPGEALVTDYMLWAENADDPAEYYYQIFPAPDPDVFASCTTFTRTMTVLPSQTTPTTYRVRAQPRNMFARYGPWSEWVPATTPAGMTGS